MLLEDRTVVKAVGLPVVHAEDDEVLGATSDVLVGEEGRVVEFCVKHGWLSHDQLLSARDTVLVDGKLITSHSEREESSQSTGIGLIGVPVQTEHGHNLGKVVNVIVESPEFHVVGLELSGGLVRDWIRGRSVVVIDSPDPVTVGAAGVIVLPDDVEIQDESLLDSGMRKQESSHEAAIHISSGETSIDWTRVRDSPEEDIRQEMARIVWERHGAPRHSDEVSPWLDMAQPWAADLKRAAESGETSAFEDVAILSDDQVVALQAFRLTETVTKTD